MLLDVALMRQVGALCAYLKLLDGVDVDNFVCDVTYADGNTDRVESSSSHDLEIYFEDKEITSAVVTFNSASGAAECAVVEVEYYEDDSHSNLLGSSLVQNGSCELKLLKYKVELPRGAKVTLFDDETLEAKFVAWNLPCPSTLPNMTFLQVKAANGREAQITPSAGSQAVELYTELGRRYAVFGEIWTYSFAQTLWFADLGVQLSDDSWQNCIPTAGEGGTIVTELPH